jgi:Zn-dependent protease with chaperone function
VTAVAQCPTESEGRGVDVQELKAKPNVDRLRLGLERQLSGLVRQHPGWRQAVEVLPRPDYYKTRRLLMAHTMFLSPDMAPEVYRLARRVQRVLGSQGEVEIFQSQGSDEYAINAGVYYVTGQAHLIHVGGRVLTQLDDGGKAVVLGHEFGHILAHGPNSRLHVAPAVAWAAAQQLPSPVVQRVARAFTMAAELTADRFGLLAGQALDAFLRVEMVHASGLSASSLDWEPQAYLKQCRSLMEETLAAGESVMGTTHPEHNLRAYAAWLFSETDLYSQLTGQGSGGRTLDEVDSTLRRLMLPQGLPSWRSSVAFAGPNAAGGGAFTGRAGPMREGADSVGDEGRGTTAESVASDVGQAVGKASEALRPGLSRLKQATTAGLARVVGRRLPRSSGIDSSSSGDLSSEPSKSDPLLDDPEERELLKRFEELERKLEQEGD